MDTFPNGDFFYFHYKSWYMAKLLNNLILLFQ